MFKKTIRLLAIPSFAALAACAVPTGEESAQQDDPLTLLPHPVIPVVAPVQPTHFHAGPLQRFNLGPSQGKNFCVLSGVYGTYGSGEASGTNSYANVSDDGTSFWLSTGVGSYADATCVPWSAFTGTGTGSATSTTRSPYYGNVNSVDGSSQSVTATMWDRTSQCLISAISGQWLGYTEAPGTASYNSVQVIYLNGAYDLIVSTNSPHLSANANCFRFPGRSYVSQSIYDLSVGRSTNVALPSTSTALCGIIEMSGQMDGAPDGIHITYDSSGNQRANLSGALAGAQVICYPFVQQ